ncbi:hypothetical protein [Paenibacillus qinlingensis]|uniref:hypothetical protein n=1 Tax=Paenibacillus qinlingensis TaxID=1837343 RepID=UPI00286C3783|nr:hypothetical protein [Paenibacillus qinlingensis]
MGMDNKGDIGNPIPYDLEGVNSVADEANVPQEQETAHIAEVEINHDYDLMRAYAEQLNGEVNNGED